MIGDLVGSLLVLAIAVLAIGGVGVWIGMLVARRLGRWIERFGEEPSVRDTDD